MGLQCVSRWATIPHDVALVPPRPSLTVHTGLAVPDPQRRELVDDLLTAARAAAAR